MIYTRSELVTDYPSYLNTTKFQK